MSQEEHSECNASLPMCLDLASSKRHTSGCVYVDISRQDQLRREYVCCHPMGWASDWITKSKKEESLMNVNIPLPLVPVHSMLRYEESQPQVLTPVNSAMSSPPWWTVSLQTMSLTQLSLLQVLRQAANILSRTCPCWYLNLRLPASRTRKRQSLLFQSPSL